MKGPDAFRTISEAASELGVPQHVLRFWETKFSFIRPMKRAGGRRFYRRQDIDMLRGVRALLHEEGYTIKGVQRLHKEQGLRRVLAASGATDALEPDALEPDALEPDALEDDADDARAVGGEGPEDAVDDPRFDEAAAGRPLLGEAARRRLSAVLGDLEGVKARLDALLIAGNS